MIKQTALMLLFAAAVCFSGDSGAGSDSAGKHQPQIKDTLIYLTIEELAQYTGKNGKPAYVAVDSVIYDETGVPAWKKGLHKGYAAGTDITLAIKKSPHGIKVLKKRKVVGKLVGSSPKRE